jgi:hypothetical protein
MLRSRAVRRTPGGTWSIKPAGGTTPAAKPAAAAPVTDDDAVRLAAYRRWEAAGRPPGDGMEFWLAAERELRGA